MGERTTCSSNASRREEKTMLNEQQFCRKKFALRRTSFALVSFALLFFIIASLPSYCACAKSPKKAGKSKSECSAQTTEWSECSKACDMGTSTRVRKRRRCKLKSESRLCMIRSCDKAFFSPKIKQGKKSCLRHTKPKKEFLTYAGATSVKKYKMKYCGWCSDTKRCCTPTKSRTKKVWFKPKDGKKFFKKMSFIRKCHCHRNCRPIDSKMVYTYKLHNDMHKEASENDLPDEVQSVKSHKKKRRKNKPKKRTAAST